MKYHSFDIFDTCLLRTCGTPENFFDILSLRVFNQPVSENERQGFIIARKNAEYKSYINNNKTNIYDIYDCFSYDNPYIIPKSEILEKEIALEREVIVPAYKTKQLIDSLRKKGNHIFFISDMYLPTDIITDILETNGIYNSGDKVFVSCDIGASKYNGEIFEYIHNNEKIAYKDWTHYGDNKQCDIKVPHKLGIKTVKINHEYSTYEKKWIETGGVTILKYQQLVAGISRSLFFNLTEHPRKKLLLDIIAPLYVSFVGYVFESARQKGIKKLFFCARDTYQMYQVAKEINHKYPEIEIKYLRVSRKSISDSKPDIIIKYFEQEGLASKSYYAAIIDSAAGGTSFSKINELLADFGYNEAYGFFLIKFYSPFYTNESTYTGAIREEYVQNNHFFTPIFKNKKIVTILENVFSSNNGRRTVGYELNDGTVTPVFSYIVENEDSVQQNTEEMQSYHTEILKYYAKIYINLGLLPYSYKILHELAIPTFSFFAYYPSKEYTESLLNCYQKDNNILLPYLKKESLFSLICTKGNDTCWSRATIFYNLPKWTHSIILKYINYRESL
ncbi:MAG: hypothetical protein J6X58_03320 [Bacteroidales bacterium]|nr:hypothetical protein [Bacteroidales bacterium]